MRQKSIWWKYNKKNIKKSQTIIQLFKEPVQSAGSVLWLSIRL